MKPGLESQFTAIMDGYATSPLASLVERLTEVAFDELSNDSRPETDEETAIVGDLLYLLRFGLPKEKAGMRTLVTDFARRAKKRTPGNEE